MNKPNMNIILALLVVANVILIILPINHASNVNCSYYIEIETSCAASAGTKDMVGVRFGDSRGDLVVVKELKNPKVMYGPKVGEGKQKYKGQLERCGIERFQASGVCMTHAVCSLYVKQFGSDGWRPGWVKVFLQRDDGHVSLASEVFYFRRFVPGNVWFGQDYCHANRGALPHVAAGLGGDNKN